MRTLSYSLADRIYPDWALFGKKIKKPTTEKEGLYSKAQEAFRRDLERAFGVLVLRSQILQ